MTGDVRRISYLACAFLVLLRISIGWQFLHEGLWKLDTLSTAKPWTSEGYLKASKGPFRGYFIDIVGDPYELNKLDYDKVVASWKDWLSHFKAHHPDLTKSQLEELDANFNLLVHGKPEIKSDRDKGLDQYLKDNPAWLGVIREKYEGTSDYKTIGEIELYKDLVNRYEDKLAHAKQDFQYAHLEKIWADLQEKRRMLIGPIDNLTDQLADSAQSVLTVQQLSRGPVVLPATEVERVDRITIWGISIIGFCLIAGLFSRTAALGGACFLTLFYLAIPPWPGVPQPPGPEHSFIVNKNFIEIVACLALMCLPSGRWIGLDALVRRFIFRQTTD